MFIRPLGTRIWICFFFFRLIWQVRSHNLARYVRGECPDPLHQKAVFPVSRIDGTCPDTRSSYRTTNPSVLAAARSRAHKNQAFKIIDWRPVKFPQENVRASYGRYPGLISLRGPPLHSISTIFPEFNWYALVTGIDNVFRFAPIFSE